MQGFPHAPPVTAQTPRDGEFPRLARQYYAYIETALANFEKVRGQDPAKPDTSASMQPIAHALTESQIAAGAAYLNSFEYHIS